MNEITTLGYEMKTLTLEQLRALQEGGGVTSVTLTANGGHDFSVQIEMRKGGDAVLVATNTKQPRTFADPRRALALLRDLGIREARIDARNWAPEQRAIA